MENQLVETVETVETVDQIIEKIWQPRPLLEWSLVFDQVPDQEELVNVIAYDTHGFLKKIVFESGQSILLLDLNIDKPSNVSMHEFEKDRQRQVAKLAEHQYRGMHHAKLSNDLDLYSKALSDILAKEDLVNEFPQAIEEVKKKIDQVRQQLEQAEETMFKFQDDIPYYVNTGGTYFAIRPHIGDAKLNRLELLKRDDAYYINFADLRTPISSFVSAILNDGMWLTQLSQSIFVLRALVSKYKQFIQVDPKTMFERYLVQDFLIESSSLYPPTTTSSEKDNERVRNNARLKKLLARNGKAIQLAQSQWEDQEDKDLPLTFQGPLGPIDVYQRVNNRKLMLLYIHLMNQHVVSTMAALNLQPNSRIILLIEWSELLLQLEQMASVHKPLNDHLRDHYAVAAILDPGYIDTRLYQADYIKSEEIEQEYTKKTVKEAQIQE